MHQPEVANAPRVLEVECFEAGQPFEVCQALIRDLSPPESQHSEPGKPCETCQALVRHLGAPEIQPLQLGEPYEVCQALVRDLGSADFQYFEIGQPADVYQPVIGDSGLLEEQPLQLGQSLEMFQAGIHNLGVLEIDPNHRHIWTFRVHFDRAPQLLDFGNGPLLLGLAVLSWRRGLGRDQENPCQGDRYVQSHGRPLKVKKRPQPQLAWRSIVLSTHKCAAPAAASWFPRTAPRTPG